VLISLLHNPNLVRNPIVSALCSNHLFGSVVNLLLHDAYLGTNQFALPEDQKGNPQVREDSNASEQQVDGEKGGIQRFSGGDTTSTL
jgi:hypothetical protein